MNKELIVPIPSTLEAAEKLLGKIAAGDSELRQLAAAMTTALAAVLSEHEPGITAQKKFIDAQRDALEQWAWTAQREEFAEKRSMDLLHGTIGFRWAKPKLATLARITWDKALEKIKALRPEFVRVKEEVNKELILQQAADELINAGGLSAMGLKVVQEESFYIDLKC